VLESFDVADNVAAAGAAKFGSFFTYPAECGRVNYTGKTSAEDTETQGCD
jgi:hypothetical protein